MAAATGVAALGTEAVKSYADYEQLVGGVETLFGTGGMGLAAYAESIGKTSEEALAEFDKVMTGQNTVLRNADAAYKTAGLSANEYMETVTSFAASLKQSCESEIDAANAADQAVIDMSDNANKMGTSMESIQNAYQGFAKQNYTMLDNLKLGYGGTKEEMQRLLSDAEKLSGQKYDISNLKDVYAAIHVIQDELGITGTTAKEASTTIQGSVNAMKASWENLVTGIANEDADFDALISNFVESAGTAFENILPRVEIALTGIGQLVENLLPIIVNEFPVIINNILPELLQSGINMVSTLLSGIQQSLPQISQGAMQIIVLLLTTFIQMLPQLLDIGMQIIVTIANGILQNLPQIIQQTMLIIEQIVTTLGQMLPQLLEMGLQVIVQLAIGIAQALPDLIPTIVDVVLQITETLLDNIDLLIDAAMELIVGLAEGIVNALPLLIEKAPIIIAKLASAIISNAPKLLEASAKIIVVIANGLITNTPKLLRKVPEITQKVRDEFISGVHKFAEVAKNIICEIADGLIDNIHRLTGKTPTILVKLKDSFLEAVDQFADIGEMIITNIWSGISSGWDWLTGKVSELASSLFKTATDALGKSSGGSGSGTTVNTVSKKSTAVYNPAKAVAQDQMNGTVKMSNYRLASGYVVGGQSTAINYDKVGSAVASAIEHAGLKVEISQREFGRIVREVSG